ncbi:DUF6712 family protein [Flavobacterium sp. RHBU_3]|uniref:DUF6712 family protein n=1 Tax=Flavobacterium sp. RHBU_3 TaxID=3391184 RepID=UPI0039852AC4
MKLMFDRDGLDPSEEIKELLPWIDADITYAKLRPDIRTATNEMIRLIGQPMYDIILAVYNDVDANDEDAEELVYNCRFPILIRAYALYAPKNDIAHTTNGRRMRQDDNEKSPWQWMVDADNEAMERGYYRALDDMLAYLETVEEWKEQEAYKALNKLFITNTDQFTQYFAIESRYVLMKLMPGIRQCEQREIRSRLTPLVFDALKDKLKAGQDLTENEKELLELIQEACVYYSLGWAMRRLSVTIFPEGILQAYTSDRDTTKIKQPAKNLESDAAEQAFMSDAAEVFLRIEKFLAPPPAQPQEIKILPEIKTGSNYLSF